MATVSVIMNGLNCARYLREAIESVYDQTYTDWEIVFWDNASSDETPSIAQGYDHRVRYFRGQQTVPLGAARNLAIAQATGDFLAFLDCDDLWLPDKLTLQLPLFAGDRPVGLVYSNSIFLHQDTGREHVLYRRHHPPSGRVFRQLLSDYFLSMETVVIRRAALGRLSEWFDERFNVVEEADLFIRIAHDWDVMYCPRVLAKWRMHRDSWTWTRSELFADEFQLMLEKLILLFPDLATHYRNEIRSLEARIAYRKALSPWRKGSRGTARRLIRPYLTVKPELLFPYLFTYLPYGAYERALRALAREV